MNTNYPISKERLSMFVYDRLDWPKYLDKQSIKEFFWKEFSFEQKLLHSFGLLHIDTEGITEPGHRDTDERLRYFIFEEGVLFILSGYYPSETPYERTEKIKIPTCAVGLDTKQLG